MSKKKLNNTSSSKGPFERAAATITIFLFCYPTVFTAAYYLASVLQKHALGVSSRSLSSDLLAPFTGFGITMWVIGILIIVTFPTPVLAVYFAFRAYLYSWFGWLETTAVAFFAALFSWIPYLFFRESSVSVFYSWSSFWLHTWRNLAFALASALAALLCWKFLRWVGVLQLPAAKKETGEVTP